MRYTSAFLTIGVLAAACWALGASPRMSPTPGAPAGAALWSLLTFAVAVVIDPRR